MARKLRTRVRHKDPKRNVFDLEQQRLTLDCKKWLLRFVEPPLSADNRRGDADAPSTKGKQIRIQRPQDLAMMMDTITHEILHCLFWDLDEEAVNSKATDINKAQWSLGIRPLDAEMLAMWEERYGPKPRKPK